MEQFRAEHGLRSARLRYFNAAGADPAAEIGKDRERETRLIPLAVDVVSGRKPYPSLFGSE